MLDELDRIVTTLLKRGIEQAILAIEVQFDIRLQRTYYSNDPYSEPGTLGNSLNHSPQKGGKLWGITCIT
jgi:hypothetical protein